MKKNFKLTAGLLGLALTAAAAQAGISAGENVTFPLTDTVNLEMIWIEPGTFIMGSPRNEPGRWSTEVQHEVTLTKGYWMGKYEVTQAQYEAVTGSCPSGLKEADLPVEVVRWYDATNFCAKLTEIEKAAGRLPEGYEFTLPTEAQWEYACRAGTTTAFNNGKDLTEAGIEQCSEMDEVGWYKCNSDFKTHPVGQKKPNAWGLYDMHGNMAEWCLDWFGDYPESSVTDPMGPDTGLHRVIRGGSCYTSNAGGCRSAFRIMSNPGDNLNNYGFRVALIKTQQDEPATISCKTEGNVLIINYTGTLYQSTDTVNWTEVAGAASPYKVTMSEHKLFFRTQGGVPIYQNMTIPLEEDVDLDLIWIEPGTFVMGSPEDEIGHVNGIYPYGETRHTETIRYGFWLGKYEVTHEQYKAIMGENPSQFTGGGKPVETVNWYDAMSFCEKLTAREKEAGRLPAGYKYTLPTDVEWEYACRAGTTTAFNNGTNIPTEEQKYGEPCPNLDQVGWYWLNADGTVHTVGQKKPNAWGLYDMHGNVAEWTSSKAPELEEEAYIMRGGSWDHFAVDCRSASFIADKVDPNEKRGSYGFRVALTAIP